MPVLNFVSKFLIYFFLLTSYFLLPTATIAAEMKSGSYQIRVDNSRPGNSQQSAGQTGSQDASGSANIKDFTQTGYYSKTGLSYLKTVLPFSFNITELTIDFGKLDPGAPVIKNHILNVDTGGSANYRVLAFANHPLKIINATTIIPDTTCNNSQAACDETMAKPWTDNNIYGFGFNISGDDIPSDFINQTYFRQFSDGSIGEKPQVILEGINIYRSRQAIINYKVNVLGLQATGIYDNVVNLIAVPGY